MKVKNKKFLKKAASVALGVGLVSSTLSSTYLPLPTIVHADTNSTTESILAKLTPEQRQALEQLSTDDQTGLFLNSKVNLDSSNNVSVIVEFKNKPHKVAVLEAAESGKSLSETEAMSNVDSDHTKFKNDLEATFKTKSDGSYKVKREYKNAFNGVALEVPANKIKDLMKSSAVQAIYSDSTVSVEPPEKEAKPSTEAQGAGMSEELSYLNINKLHQEGYTGSGVKVAVLDTGVDYNHPDIKGAYKGGYDFVDNDNDPMETTYADWVKAGKLGGDPSAYVTEHGTHVSGTIVGQGKNDSPYATTGIAPDADLYVYRVLGPGGSGTSENIIAAIDQAVADGMDVMNLSLGANYNDPLFPDSIAINNAVLNGVTAVVAAGNAGSGMYTVGSPGSAALALTVGASDIPEQIPTMKGNLDTVTPNMHLLAKGFSDDIASLLGKTYQIVNIGGYGQSWNYTNLDVTGKVVLVQRGINTINDKILQAKLKGAAAILIWDNVTTEDYMPFYLGEGTDFIPSFNLTNADGLALQQKIAAGNTEFSFSDLGALSTTGDNLADFSSRGPARITYDIKPEVTAPGVSVLSTVPGFVHSPDNPGDYKYAYERMSGTSMATPNVTGIAALLLQAHPGLQPEDVKSILMNTADPLKNTYSVFEEGAGRVDPYKAIHSDIEIKVKEKTPTIINGREKQMKEDTGAISFGNEAYYGKDIIDSRSVTFENNGSKDKTFDVKVTYQTDVRGSKDAVKNGVEITSDQSIKVPANSNVNRKVTLSIPATAEKGIYEGYIVYTNHDDSSETYRVPFGVHYVEEGIDSVDALPMFSTDTAWPENAWPFESFTFALKSHMKTLDIILQDATTGEDLGLIGSFDPILLNENQTYFVTRGFTGTYSPFTGDPKNPIGNQREIAQPGHYKIKLIGSNEQGDTFTKSADFIYDLGAPTMTSSFDSLDQKVIEYNDSQFDSNGEFLYDFNINLHDPETDEASKLGLPVDQSNNSVVTFYNSPWPKAPIYTDKNGNYTDKLVVRKQAAPLQVQFYGMDYARNFNGNAFNMLRVVFVDHNLPYYYLKANKQIVTTGDTVNYSVRSNNVKNLKTTKITIPVDSNLASIENVVVNDAVKQYGDAQVSVTTTPSGGMLNYTITFTYLGDKTLPEDLQLFNFDLKTAKKFTDGLYGGSAFNWYTMSASTTDQSNVETKNVYTYMESIKYKPTYSRLDGSVQVEGAKDSTGQPIYSLDLSKIGANVKVTSYDGKTSVNAPSLNRSGQYIIEGLKAEVNPYTVTVDVPGHFTMSRQLVLSNNVRGEIVGKRLLWNLPTAAGGDVNKDNVIDINDALAIQTYWGTNKTSADINFDGTVDAKDFAFVEKNFGLQNSTVPNAPKPVLKYKGKTLAEIKKELGIQ